MSNRLAAAYADAWLSADFAASKRALKDDIFEYKERYSKAVNNLSAKQTSEMEDKSMWGLIGSGLGAAVGFYFGGTKGAALGWEYGGEAGDWAFDTGVGRTGDEEIDRLAKQLEDMEIELSGKSKRYGVLGAREEEEKLKGIKEKDLDVYESWSDQFYEDSWSHMTDIATIYAKGEAFQKVLGGIDEWWFSDTELPEMPDLPDLEDIPYQGNVSPAVGPL